MRLLAILFTAQLVYTCAGDGIMCKTCRDGHVTAEDAYTESILESSFDMTNNPDCRYNPDNIESVTYCDHPARCIVLDALFDMSVTVFTEHPVGVSLALFTRECLPAEWDHWEERCHDLVDMSDEMSQAMGDDVTVHDLSGSFCVCNNANCTKP